MAKDALTQDDVDQLGWLLNDRDDRTAFYLHYYELTGNEQVLAMAKISQLTELEGAVAQRCANEVVQEQYPGLYPAGGVFQFSHEVAPHLYEAITKDFTEGTGTGVLPDRAVLESAREAWDARGLGEQFPGNPLLAIDRAADFDFKGAWEAINSQGTDIAVEAAVYSVIPDISGNPNPSLQDRLDNASYHVTEDGKEGFYVDRETGITVAVFDRPADLSSEPPIESRGVLNTWQVPEHTTTDQDQAPTASTDEPAPLHEQSAHSFLFDAKPNEPFDGSSPFAASDASGSVASPPGFGQSPLFEPAPALSEELQLPAGLLNLDFGTGGATPAPHDDHSALPDAFQEPSVTSLPEPVGEPTSGGFFSNVLDIFGPTTIPADQANASNTPSSWVSSQESAAMQEPASPSMFDQVTSWFSSPPPAHEEVQNIQETSWGASQESYATYEPASPSVFDQVTSWFSTPPPASDAGQGGHESNVYADSYHDASPSSDSSFGGWGSPSHESAPSYESSYSHDSGYASHDSGYASHDSGSSSHDSGQSSFDSGSHDSGSMDAGGGSGSD